MSRAVLPARTILPWPRKPCIWSEKCRCVTRTPSCSIDEHLVGEARQVAVARPEREHGEIAAGGAATGNMIGAE